MAKKAKIAKNKGPKILLSYTPPPPTRVGLERGLATMKEYGANDDLIAKIQKVIDHDYPAND